jgi:enoyl-[acyl-carrier protein] reductase II
MLKTKITKEYNLGVPFISAGMAFVAMPALVAAVSNAGGMGVLGGSAMPPAILLESIKEIRKSSKGTFGVNFIAHTIGDEHIDICIQEKVPVVTFHWDNPPREWIQRLHSGGCRVWFQVGSLEEAVEAIKLGANALIVQGNEAGGHNRAKANIFSLLPAVVDIAGMVPVIAAGGIADERGAAAAFALGAEAIWVGTRMLASKEAFAHEEYKQKLVDAQVDETSHHFVFGPDFPDAPVRSLRNKLVSEYEDQPAPYKELSIESLPVIGQANIFGQTFPLVKFMSLPPTPEFSGDLEQMNLSAGESVGQIKNIQSAADIINEMMKGTEKIIKHRLLKMVTRD